jgi:flavin reductase (DIM6/NTAB) family NADH-FMN oxidoreductase RutF
MENPKHEEGTMKRSAIPFGDLQVRSHHLWAEQWMLLTSGDLAAGKFNTMAVGWGSLGTMWNRPFAQVVVRPTRYTYEFMEQFDSFTLCAFPEKFRKAVQLLGSKSGRDGDKIAASGLTPAAAAAVAAPAFAEAELVIECRKLYWDDLAPRHFVDGAIGKNYPKKDYHRIYFGEIVAVSGVESWKA